MTLAELTPGQLVEYERPSRDLWPAEWLKAVVVAVHAKTVTIDVHTPPLPTHQGMEPAKVHRGRVRPDQLRPRGTTVGA